MTIDCNPEQNSFKAINSEVLLNSSRATQIINLLTGSYIKKTIQRSNFCISYLKT